MDFRRHLGERRYRLMVRMRRAAVEKIQHRRRLHRETVNGGKDWGGVSSSSQRIQISDGLLDPH